MIVQMHSEPAGYALLAAAVARINIHDCLRSRELAADLHRRCVAAPGEGLRFRPGIPYLAPRWSTFAVLSGRAKEGPIEDESAGLAAAWAAAMCLFWPGRHVALRVDDELNVALQVDGTSFADLSGVPARTGAHTGSARVEATGGFSHGRMLVGHSRRLLKVRKDLMVEVQTDIAGLTHLLAGMAVVNIHDCARDSRLRDDLQRRSHAPAHQGFEYHRDPPYLPDRWTSFSVESEATDSDAPIEDDCEGKTANYAAASAIFTPERRTEVCIAQPEPGKMAHAFNRFNGRVFDGSVFNGMRSPPPDFYESGEHACIHVEI